MPSWARYACAIYFGLMMSGAMAPPEWGVASTAPPKVRALTHAKPVLEKYDPDAPDKPGPATMGPADSPHNSDRAAPCALPADTDLLR